MRFLSLGLGIICLQFLKLKIINLNKLRPQLKSSSIWMLQITELSTENTLFAAFESDSATRLSSVMCTQLKCWAAITDWKKMVQNSWLITTIRNHSQYN